ncbi:uncharacterized protein [Aristolochia californica]|uniref:uncharacterized protein n=1 Tax=Aristolochia californica TaxID=171875 RepID=UPI0035E20843
MDSISHDLKIDGQIIAPEPTSTDFIKENKKWLTDNAKIITWINNSVDPSISLQLLKYETAKEIWDYLETLYEQTNFAKRYQIETELRSAKQGNRTIQEFYSFMTPLWDQLYMMDPPSFRKLPEYTRACDDRKLTDFLMAFHSDFELIRGSMIHRAPLPTLSAAVSELLAEETRLRSLGGLSSSKTSSPDMSQCPSLQSNNKNQGNFKPPQHHASSRQHQGHFKSAPHHTFSRPPHRGFRPFAAIGSLDYSEAPPAPAPPSSDYTPDLSSLAAELTPILGKSSAPSTQFASMQDRKSGRQIGIGHREGGLYLLDDLKFPASLHVSSLSVQSMLQDLLSSEGTIHQLSCPYTPQQNGVAERKHRHLVETARSLLLHASVPSEFCGEALHTATYLINRIPSFVSGSISPFERLYGVRPTYEHLRVFGCACFVLLPPSYRTKLSAKSALCVFLGYGFGQKGYRCYHPESGKLFVSRNVKFLEQFCYFRIPLSTPGLHDTELLHIDPFVSDEPHDDQLITHHPSPDSPLRPEASSSLPSQQSHVGTDSSSPMVPLPLDSLNSSDPHLATPRVSTRVRRPPQGYSPSSYLFFSPYLTFLSKIHSFVEPKSYKEAASDANWR